MTIHSAAANGQSAPTSESPACPHCGGAGYRRVERDGYQFVQRCVCRRDNDLKQAKAAAGIPLKFRETTLSERSNDGRDGFKPYGGGKRDLVAIESQKRAVEACRSARDLYLRVFRDGRPTDDVYGLLLYGDCGRGKTRLACSLLCDLIHAGLTEVRFVEYTHLFKKIRFSYDSKEPAYQAVFEDLLRAKVLVIDDLGADVSGNLAWILDNIGYIINERYGMNRPTILTCNHWRSLREEQDVPQSTNIFEGPSWQTGAAAADARKRDDVEDAKRDLEQRVSYRLRSRILEMCLEVPVLGYDYRRRINRYRENYLARQKERSPKKS